MTAWAGSTRSSRLPADWHRRRGHVLKRDGHRCRILYAGTWTVAGRTVQCVGKADCVDHINDDDNHDLDALQAACTPCNQRKNHERRARREPLQRPPERHPGLL